MAGTNNAKPDYHAHRIDYDPKVGTVAISVVPISWYWQDSRFTGKTTTYTINGRRYFVTGMDGNGGQFQAWSRPQGWEWMNRYLRGEGINVNLNWKEGTK